MNRRVAFLTMDDLSDFVCYDAIAATELRARGWRVDDVSWRRGGVDWSAYAVVFIRSPWDYHKDPDAFLARLAEIDASPARLENALSIVKWNIDKRYLRDLAARGVAILPTLWPDPLTSDALAGAFAALDADEIVVKPVIGAGAEKTYCLTPAAAAAQADAMTAEYAAAGLGAMIQPFAPEITAEGEYSLFHFGGVYSHAILKTPKSGDFRVQEEWGGLLQAVTPDPAMRAAADSLGALCPEPPFVLRSDFVRWGEGWALMELEAIEPSLYFNLDEAAAARFADAAETWFGAG